MTATTTETHTPNTSNPATKTDWEAVWAHFNRMQKRVMADKTTKKEFFAESESERMDFYRWMQQQCGEYSCWT